MFFVTVALGVPLALLWATVGLVAGPILNLAAYRLPRLEALTAPLECPRCHVGRPLHTQSALLSLLLGARGRCQGCGAAPETTAALTELATGAAFWLLFLRFGVSPRLLLYSLYSCFLIVVFLIDWRHRLILNRITYPGIALSVLLTSTLTPVGLVMTLAGVVAAGLLFGSLYAIGRLIFRQEVLGLGDVKLAMLLGAMAGFPAVAWWLLLGSLFGAVGGLAMVAARRSSLRDFMPYGTAMCLGAFTAFFLDSSLLF